MKQRLEATHFIEQYNPTPGNKEHAPFQHSFAGPYPLYNLEMTLSYTRGSIYTVAIFKIKFHNK